MQDGIEARRDKFIHDYDTDKDKFREYAEYILSTLKEALKSRQIDIAYASAREKDIKSLAKKCQKQIKNDNGDIVNKYTDFRKQITDLAGVRIVTYLLDDIEQVSQIIRELFVISEEHSGNKLDLLGADKIGYLSVHFIVKLKDTAIMLGKEAFREMKCEIQVRTVLQDAWAQIFHDRQYKNELQKMDSEKLLRRTNLLSGNLELLDYQINGLVKEYDQLNQVERSNNLRKILNESISEANLLSYLDCKLGRKTVFHDYVKTSELLKVFEIRSIRDLDTAMGTAHCENELKAYSRLLSADRIISYILVIYDGDRFFEYKKDSLIVCGESFEFLKEFIDIKELCHKYSVKVKNGGKN